MKNLQEEIKRSKQLMGITNNNSNALITYIGESTDSNMYKVLIESANEIGVNVQDVINRESKLLRENSRELLTEAGITLAIIGTALASGKLLDLIGSIIKKIQNVMVQQGWLKGDKWETTKISQAGEWIQKNIISRFFKYIAKALLTPIAYFAGTISEMITPGSSSNISSKVLNDKSIDALANVLFYVAISYAGLLGFKAALPNLTTGGFLPILEMVTSSIKGYELIWLVVAVVVVTVIDKFQEYKSQVPKLAHSLMGCFEGESLNPIKAMGKIKKDNDQYLTCITGHMSGDHGEHKDQEPNTDQQNDTPINEGLN